MAIENLSRSLAGHPFVAGLAPGHVDFLSGCAKNVRVGADELLFREDEEAGASWLIRDGRVSLEIDVPGKGPTTVQTVEAGEVVGWSWLFPPYRWHFDARALVATRAFQIDGPCLRRKCESEPDFGYEIVRRLLLQVHRRLERTRVQLLDVYGGRD